MPEGNPLNKVAKIDDNLAQWQNPSEKKSLVKSYSAIVVSWTSESILCLGETYSCICFCSASEHDTLRIPNVRSIKAIW